MTRQDAIACAKEIAADETRVVAVLQATDDRTHYAPIHTALARDTEHWHQALLVTPDRRVWLPASNAHPCP